MFTVFAMIIAGVIGFYGGYNYGFYGLLVAVPLGFLLGWMASKADNRR